jgi:uncharacterized membrane protein/Mg-chelatase subunit ChlD
VNATLPVTADAPWYLLLLALVPVIWYFSFRSLAALGTWRRLAAILFRTTVFALLVLAAAELQWVRSTDRLTVIYLLDQSLSIPLERRTAMIDYVNAAIRRHRDGKDQAGVIVFGREATIEIPPYDEDVRMEHTLESRLDPEYTNLAGAIKLAQASFPEDTAKRIVIISDGNENLGNGLEQAEAAREAGIAIDVFPITYSSTAEVALEKITLPPDVRRGQPFDMRIVLNNTTPLEPGKSGVVSGRLIVSERTDDQPIVLSDQHIDLPPGKHVFTLRQQIDRPQFYSYDARFVPDNLAEDTLAQNNRGTAFTHVRGSGQILLIEDDEHQGEHGLFVERLRKDNLEVTVRSSKQLFTGLAELQPFDTVILANVPREHFSDQQIGMLASNTQDLGCGLIMLGGPNSFGAGGWTNTEVEKAMPLDFQIKSAKVIPKGALALLMHASEMPDGNHWQKVIAMEAIKALGSEDYCGVLHWNGIEQWLWGGLTPVRSGRDQMLAKVDRMVPGDMPNFDPAMVKARTAFAGLKDAAVKHMIVISDGDPTPPSQGVIKALKDLAVTVSTVAVGCHGPAQSSVLKDLAQQTGGKYYEVQNPQTLPKIFQKEARRVARPLIYENDQGFRPSLRFPHEITSGLDGALPPLTGYVMTTVKANSLVEVSMVSPVPEVEDNTTILASWTYGLGKAIAFTTDVGTRWASNWTQWANYDKLFTQMVRWSMRPVAEEGKFTVATDVSEGRVNVFVTALDKNDEFLNFLDLGGAVIGPEMGRQSLRLKQTAPGRYVGSFDAKDAGSYFLTLSSGAGKAPLLTGVNVPYSAEFRDRGTKETLLTTIAARPPSGVPVGEVIKEPTAGDRLEELLKVNSFRHDLPQAKSARDAWPNLVWLAGCIFLADVFTRRVSVSLAWVIPLSVRLRDRLLRRQAQAPPTEYLERLRSRKAEVSQTLEQQRAAARFEPSQEATVQLESQGPIELSDNAGPAAPPSKPTPSTTGLAPDKKEDESYTSRLLKAKQRVWEDRDKPK